jgi:hypothetical protein
MELLGEALRTWPDDAAVEHADARLAAVELRIAALAPRTGAGLAVKLRLACMMWAGGDLLRPSDGDPRPIATLQRLVGEAEALDGAVARDVGHG